MIRAREIRIREIKRKQGSELHLESAHPTFAPSASVLEE